MNKPILARKQCVQAIKQLLEEASIVLVRGSEGIGKTTILKQFTEDNASRSIYYEIAPFGTWSYDPQAMVPRICEQVRDKIGKHRQSAITGDDQLTLRKLYAALAGTARRANTTVTFVLRARAGITDSIIRIVG